MRIWYILPANGNKSAASRCSQGNHGRLFPTLRQLGWKLADIGVNDGDIYAVVDGKLSNVTTYTFAEVCASYSDNGVYEAADHYSFMGGTTDVDTLDEIKQLIADKVIEHIREKWMISSTGNTAELRKEFGKKVTLIGMSGVSLTTDVHKLVTNPEARYTINYVYTKDGTAIGWLNESNPAVKGTGVVAKSKMDTVAPDFATVTGEDAALAAIKPTVTWTYDPATGLYVYKLLFDESTMTVKDVNDIIYTNGSQTKHAADPDNDGIWGETDKYTTSVGLTSITVTITRDCGKNLYYVINF